MDDYSRITSAFNNKANINYNNFTVRNNDQVDVVKPNSEKLSKLCNKWYVKAETYDSKYVMFSELKWYQVIKEIVMRLFGSEGSKDIYKGSTCKKFIDAKYIAESSQNVQSTAQNTTTAVQNGTNPIANNTENTDSTPQKPITKKTEENAPSTPESNQVPVSSTTTTGELPVASPSHTNTAQTPTNAPKQNPVNPDLIKFEIGGVSLEAIKNRKDSLNRDSILVLDIKSDDLQLVTTRLYPFVKESFDLGYKGRFHFDNVFSSSGNSLFLQLCVGMIPLDREIDYANKQWGQRSSALAKYDTILSYLENGESVPGELKNALEILREIVGDLNKKDTKNVTDQMIIDAENAIEEVKNKKLSYLKDEFFPVILDLLETQPNDAEQKTNSLGNIPMVLTDEGLVRWTDAVNNNEPFNPFAQMEHLHKYMNKEQQNRLAAIFAPRQ
jgi:hypothetical protein